MKCNKCKIDISNKDDQYILGKQKLCSECYQFAYGEEIERRKLIATICKLYGISQPTGFMFAQIKRLHKQGYHYKNMRLTLLYIKEIKKFDFDIKYGLSIIEYHHDDMLSYYKELVKKRKQNKKINYCVKEIVTQPFNTHNNNKKYKQQKMKNMDKWR